MVKVSERIRSTISNAGSAPRPGHLLREAFLNAGITVLGNGMYGAVIEDQGQAFKIFGADEAGYGAFVKYLKGKSSVLLPKIQTVGTFGNYQCIHIEKLERMSVLGDRVHWDIACWASYVVDKYLWSKYGWSYKPSRVVFPAGAEKFVNKANMVGLLKKMVDWKIDNEGSHELTFDLHEGNFMVRVDADGNKQVVITDPFC